MLPHRILLDQQVIKINAEGAMGAFGLLPKHVDFATELVPGLLSYSLPGGGEGFAAVDGGILVKRGPDVLISTRQGAVGTELGGLQRQLEEEFGRSDQAERRVRTTLAQLESDLARRISELSRRGGTG